MSFATSIYEEEKTYEDGKQYADDDKLLVRFETRAVKHEKNSEAAGRPIFYDAEYIQIIVPGSRDVSVFPVDDHYKARFKKRYNAWKESGEGQQKIDGTLLAELPWMTKSQIAELNSANVQTVEQLAEMSDANALKFMGNHKLRERAKNFLEAARGEAPMLKMQAALEERDNKIEVLTRQVGDLLAAMDEMKKKK